MIGKIIESVGVNPGAASQYEPGDVGAVDSENLQIEKSVSCCFLDLKKCVLYLQDSRTAVEAVSNVENF